MFITHSYCSPETVQKVREAIEQYASFEEIIETTAGCTISTHCGPNTLGILYKRKSKSSMWGCLEKLKTRQLFSFYFRSLY